MSQTYDVCPSVVLAAASSLLQQLLEDAGLFQRSQVRDVLRDDRDLFATMLLVAVAFLAVRERAQESVVLVRGEVIPAERDEV